MSDTGRLDCVSCHQIFKYWLEFQLTDNQGKPLGGIPYTLKSWDGIVKASGVTDGQGVIREDNLPPKPMILHVDAQKLAEQLIEKSPAEIVKTVKRTGNYHQLVPGNISNATPKVEGWTQESLLDSRYYPDPSYPGFIARPSHNRRHILEIARIAKPVFAKSCLQPAGCTDAGTDTEPHTHFGEMQVIEPAHGMVPLPPQMLLRTGIGGAGALTAVGVGSTMDRGRELDKEITRLLISQSEKSNVDLFRSDSVTSNEFAMKTLLVTAGIMLRNWWEGSDNDLLSLENLQEIADKKGTAPTRVRYRFVEDAQTGQLTAVGYHTSEHSGMEDVKVRRVQYSASFNRYEFWEDDASSPALVWHFDTVPDELSQDAVNRYVPQNSSVNTKVAVLDPNITGQTPGLPIPDQRDWRDGAYINPQQDLNEIAGNSTSTPIPDAREHGSTKLTSPAPEEKDFRDYILVFPISGVPAIYVYLNSNHEEVEKKEAHEKLAKKIQQKVTAGKISKISSGKVSHTGYHGRLSDERIQEIVKNPDGVYASSGGYNNIIFAKDGDIVVFSGNKAGAYKGQAITAYGPSGQRGKSGAAIYGGLENDPGLAITNDMIINGKIPKPGGGFLSPANSLDIGG
ncbi:hypothetical protein Xmau_00620 [Xenorhabdus mauleonii]|uniref:S-type Pyocin n=1 Tax=Xenorhabdus mauleonii TaxID=351675 RepID=A0A1I3JHU8_9GAMM|nr:S-type pyocin domain-containing protein [Xenorhabdus mauleonii]PHM46214.1 hypothetical protein Xmau_00620 [Xenorhabdus mauleonii]SFI59809.1 S-type Pyocin [Xenorhabdus mauleonii]